MPDIVNSIEVAEVLLLLLINQTVIPAVLALSTVLAVVGCREEAGATSREAPNKSPGARYCAAVSIATCFQW